MFYQCNYSEYSIQEFGNRNITYSVDRGKFSSHVYVALEQTKERIFLMQNFNK